MRIQETIEKCKASDAYLLGAPFALADILASLEVGKNLLDNVLLETSLLLLQALATHAGLLLLVLESLLDELDILQTQLLADDVEITGGVDITLNVNNLGIVEAADDLEDGIDGTNVREERVTETSTGGGASGKTGNIVHGQVGGDARLGLVLLAEPVVAVVGDDDASLLGVNGGVGEVLQALLAVISAGASNEDTYGGVTKIALGDGLEESRLADVGKTDDTALQVVAGTTQRDLLLDNVLLGRHLLSGFGVAAK